MRTIKNLKDFQNWIYKKDEVGAILEEGFASSYAASTCNTEDDVAKKNVEYFAGLTLDFGHSGTHLRSDNDIEASNPQNVRLRRFKIHSKLYNII